MSDKYQMANSKVQTNQPSSTPRFDLENRTISFSKQVINFCKQVKGDRLAQPLISQLIRSATSIGANYHEANNASSKKDFRNKLYIAKKEAQETCYWLNLFEELVDDSIVEPLKKEATELTKILQTIIKKVEI